MKSISIAAALVILSGCAATTVEPQVVYRDKIVKIPVKEKCTVVMPPEPKYEVETVTMETDWVEMVKALVIEIEQRRDYQTKMAAAAKKCE